MTTNNHPANGPVSLDRLHQISEILSKAAAQSDGGNIGYAMADAVKVIDEAIAAFGAEPVAWRNKESGHCGTVLIQGKSPTECGYEPLYLAPPAPVVPEPKSYMDFWEQYPDMTAQEAIDRSAGWNACRAAMLQAGNSPSKCSLRDGIEAIRNSGIPVDVDKIQSECEAGNHTEQHLDMVDHFVDANEKANCKLPFDQWLSQQNEPIDVDCGCVTTEAFYHWLRVAYEAGNFRVTPDGWQLVPKEPTDEMNKAGWAAMNEHDAINPTYRAMIAVAPQQVVKSALEHGMQRYAGAMQKLSEGDK